MRPRTLLIASPDETLIAGLQEGLGQIEQPGNAVIVRGYPDAAALDQIVRGERVTTVIVGLSERAAALELVSQINEAHPQIVVAVAHTRMDGELIVASYRAGARDYLTVPAAPQALDAVLRLKPKAREGEAGGRLLCCLPVRGGCGSSTVAVHLAAGLAEVSGKRVLLVDFDFHAGSIGFHLKLEPKYTLLDGLARVTALDDLWEGLVTEWGGFEVLAAQSSRVPVPGELLDAVPALFQSARRTYDWVVCDLPVAVYSSSLDAMAQAEAVYLICTPETAALRQTRRKLQELVEVGLPSQVIRLVINRLGNEKAIKVTELESLLGTRVSWTLTNDYAEVNRAILEGRLVAQRSALRRQFQAMAREIVGPSQTPSATGAEMSVRRLLEKVGKSVSGRAPSESNVKSSTRR